MRRIFIATLALPLLGMAAIAQTTTAAPPVPPMTNAPAPVPSVVTTAPAIPPVAVTDPAASQGGARGANSFTEAQARSRLEQRGFTAVSALVKDTDGVWQGTATRNGIAVKVGLDYKGDISTP